MKNIIWGFIACVTIVCVTVAMANDKGVSFAPGMVIKIKREKPDWFKTKWEESELKIKEINNNNGDAYTAGNTIIIGGIPLICITPQEIRVIGGREAYNEYFSKIKEGKLKKGEKTHLTYIESGSGFRNEVTVICEDIIPETYIPVLGKKTTIYKFLTQYSGRGWFQKIYASYTPELLWPPERSNSSSSWYREELVEIRQAAPDPKGSELSAGSQ